jgi:hypothetical protein
MDAQEAEASRWPAKVNQETAMPSKRRRLTHQQRYILRVLASTQHDAGGEPFMWFDDGTLNNLISAGLIKTWRDTIELDGEPINIARMEITDAGRNALEPNVE